MARAELHAAPGRLWAVLLSVAARFGTNLCGVQVLLVENHHGKRFSKAVG